MHHKWNLGYYIMFIMIWKSTRIYELISTAMYVFENGVCETAGGAGRHVNWFQLGFRAAICPSNYVK